MAPGSAIGADTHAVLFDALGTLLALEPPAPRLRALLLARHGVEIAALEAQTAIEVEIEYYRAHLDEARDPQSLAALRRRCAEVLRGALPRGAQPALEDLEAVAQTLLASLRFVAFTDAAPALTRLRPRGLALVVVSNWDISLHGVLEQVGLAPLLDGVVTSAEAGVRKPAARIFELALARAGVTASEALHVGDSPLEDIEGARRAGIEPVLIVRGSEPAPDRVHAIRSLAEL